MDNRTVNATFSHLSTALIADSCIRLKTELRLAPPGLGSVVRGLRVGGRVLPARHRGSVDVFLEAMTGSKPGDVLVIDNEGRVDEACIGDLTTLEAKAWDLSGLVVWGQHRDTEELGRIGLPVYSYGSNPAGPRRLDRREKLDLVSAKFGGVTVDQTDVVFADDDGAIFVSSKTLDEVLKVAVSIGRVERQQAEAIKEGKKLTEQLDFDGYLAKRDSDPSYTLRKHLRQRGGAIEE